MRKLLFATLAVLAIGSFAIAPAFAGNPAGDSAGKGHNNADNTSAHGGNAGGNAPPNVPALETKSGDGRVLTMREAMAMHREDPACRVCHAAMDPIGFSLENYDAVGKWRTEFAGATIDASGLLPDGSSFDGTPGH